MEIGHMESGQVGADNAGPADGGGVRRADGEAPPAETGGVHGERLLVPERVILAPASGRFQPAPPDDVGDIDAGADITEEQVIGFVEVHGQATPVRSPFRGMLMGMLAHAGERVREGQPVAWLRLA